MILIISYKEDYTTDYVVNILNERKILYHRLNTDDIGTKHQISFKSDLDNRVTIDDYENFESVWYRRTKAPEISFLNVNEKLFFINDFKSFLNNLWASIDAKKWISHPEDINKAENKLYQLKLAQSIGFEIPKTIVSSDKNEIKNFYEKNHNGVIIKPLFCGRFNEEGDSKLIFTNRVKEEHIHQIENFVSFPIIFQEEIIKKYELRVTVVNNMVFSAKVDSQSNDNTKTDWRKERIKFIEYNLPDEIQEKCKVLVNKLNLKFGAIDIIKTESSYIFLEINPNGQWVWIENDTGLKISDEIIEYLTK